MLFDYKNCTQRFADLRWAGFSAQMFMRSKKLSLTTKLFAEHETPPIANVLLCVRAIAISGFVCLNFAQQFIKRLLLYSGKLYGI